MDIRSNISRSDYGNDNLNATEVQSRNPLMKRLNRDYRNQIGRRTLEDNTGQMHNGGNRQRCGRLSDRIWKRLSDIGPVMPGNRLYRCYRAGQDRFSPSYSIWSPCCDLDGQKGMIRKALRIPAFRSLTSKLMFVWTWRSGECSTC